jgi:TonB family protein
LRLVEGPGSHEANAVDEDHDATAPEHIADAPAFSVVSLAMPAALDGTTPLEHVNSSWVGPEIDPPDPSYLPQPWWSARTEPSESIKPGEPLHPSDPIAASAKSEPPTAAAHAIRIAPDGAQSPPAGADVRQPSARVRVAPSKVAGPVTRPSPRSKTASSTRPSFLYAAIVAIIVGGGFAAYDWLKPMPAQPSTARPEQPDPERSTLPSSPLALASGVPWVQGQRVQSAMMTKSTGPGARTPSVRTAGRRPTETSDLGARRREGRQDRVAKSTPPARAAVPGATVARRESPVVATPQSPLHAALTSRPVTASVPADVTASGLGATGAGVFDTSEVDVRPEVTRRVEPSYPEVARERGLEDIVVVRVLVSSTGRPFDARMLRRSKVDPAFDQAAMAAVKQWTFSPARKRDRTVACWLNVGVPFRMPRVASRN